MKDRLSSVKNIKNKDCCIDEMEDLLDQIADFKEFISKPHKTSDPRYIQEYKLFKQYVEWVSEDLISTSYICNSKLHSKH